jgi:adhesin transport system membrane fusion protein
LFFIFAIYWAANAQVDEITKGDGKVISSKQLQKLQSLEGGIVSEVLISSGDRISKDDVLLVIDDTKFKSNLEEIRKKLLILEVQKQSLSSELKDEPLVFSADLINEIPVIAQQEMDFFATRQEGKESIELIYENRIEKLDNNFAEFSGKADNLRKKLELAEKELEEIRKKLLILEAQKESFSSELKDEPLVFSADLINEIPVITQQEMDFFATREKEKESIELTYENRIEKLDNNFAEFSGKADNLRKNLKLAEEELEIYRSLQNKDLVSKVELIALEKELNNIEGQLFEAEIKAQQIETLKTEALNERDSSNLSTRNKAQEKLNSTLAEIEILEQSEVVALDRVDRTLIRSPVNGIVQRVLANTISSVIQPGEDLIEIVPIDDALLIEARIRPVDIGFLSPGQDVIVKFSAYDYAIYGGLKGNLEYISADTVVDRDESYYLIKVRTDVNYIELEKERLEIIPGMTASVNIITGKKTVLDYLLKPVLRAKHNSMHER